MISESGFNMIFTEDLDEAASKAVRMSAILKMAREANLNVNLTSWKRKKNKRKNKGKRKKKKKIP